MAFANSQQRAVLTLNRRDFIRLHNQGTEHAGIVVCKDDADKVALGDRIHQTIQAEVPLTGKLIRVVKGS